MYSLGILKSKLPKGMLQMISGTAFETFYLSFFEQFIQYYYQINCKIYWFSQKKELFTLALVIILANHSEESEMKKNKNNI